MIGNDRRLNPRTTVERLAFINIEPDNGGIVLNASGGGLCFHSVAPVQRNMTVRFWLSEHNRRVEGEGELVWTDETQKTGGLRFTTVPADARQQIQDWIAEPTVPLAEDKPSAPAPAPRPFPDFSTGRPDTTGPSAASAPAGAGVFSPGIKVRIRLSGFSSGLATGLLISALVATISLFHTHRHQLGETLIRWGERLAPKPSVMQPVSPAAQKLLPARQTPLPAAARSPVPHPEKPLAQPLIISSKPQPVNLKPVQPTTPAAADASVPKTAALADVLRSSATPPTIIASPGASVVPNPNPLPGKASIVPPPTPAQTPVAHAEDSIQENAGSISQMYFEVDKFKDALRARKTIDKLAQLGFRATAIQRGHLWMNYYRVLVGPYGHDEQATAAYKNLMSHGFKPRAFERGSRNVTLRSGLTVGATRIPVGDYVISWESYVNHSKVKFLQDDYVVATAHGKWVKCPVRYENGAIVYRKNDDGSRTLLQIQFAGMGEALVFSKPS